MTRTILDYDSTTAAVGAIFRRRRPGRESDLVHRFLEELPLSLPRGCHVTIFCEPRLESGFPDLVLVIWNVGKTRRWNPERATLLREDIRLLHYLYLHRGSAATSDVLKHLFPRRLYASLDRLSAAHLVRERGGLYWPRSLSYAFAVRRIIAIEAKMSEWSAAVEQAFVNTWFASDSYVLLPNKRRTHRLRAMARSRGVRICSPGEPIILYGSAPRRTLPRSYASWLFNEWAWRFAECNGGLST